MESGKLTPDKQAYLVYSPRNLVVQKAKENDTHDEISQLFAIIRKFEPVVIFYMKNNIKDLNINYYYFGNNLG